MKGRKVTITKHATCNMQQATEDLLRRDYVTRVDSNGDESCGRESIVMHYLLTYGLLTVN